MQQNTSSSTPSWVRSWLILAVSTGTGFVFGLGLLFSEMSNPAKVLAFLNLSGPWDPSLALVMVGAIGVALPAFYLAKKMPRSLLGMPMQMPVSKSIDRDLILGAVLFGLGWGLAGFCPGPALVAGAALHFEALVFLGAMTVGMWVFN